MNKAVIAVLGFLVLTSTLVAQSDHVRIVLSPASTIPKADLVKDFQRCPNVSIILDSHQSDFMLEAGGWSGDYKFTVFRKGGEAVYSTTTKMRSNAVKDVCRFMTGKK